VKTQINKVLCNEGFVQRRGLPGTEWCARIVPVVLRVVCSWQSVTTLHFHDYAVEQKNVSITLMVYLQFFLSNKDCRGKAIYAEFYIG